MTTTQTFLFILAITTATVLYGMIKKKGWFWEPEKNLYSLFAWQSLWNIPFRYFWGKWGVIVFNMVMLAILWGVVLYFVF